MGIHSSGFLLPSFIFPMALPRSAALRGSIRSFVAKRTGTQARTTLRNVGRRTYAQEHSTKKSSDLPWLVGSLVVTVPAAGWLWQQGPSKSDHGHGHAEHMEEAEETSGEESVEEEQPKDEPEESKEEGKERKTKMTMRTRSPVEPWMRMLTPRDLQMERNELPQRKLARNKLKEMYPELAIHSCMKAIDRRKLKDLVLPPAFTALLIQQDLLAATRTPRSPSHMPRRRTWTRRNLVRSEDEGRCPRALESCNLREQLRSPTWLLSLLCRKASSFCHTKKCSTSELLFFLPLPSRSPFVNIQFL